MIFPTCASAVARIDTTPFAIWKKKKQKTKKKPTKPNQNKFRCPPNPPEIPATTAPSTATPSGPASAVIPRAGHASNSGPVACSAVRAMGLRLVKWFAMM
jgi:outer membrane biosynthesis protein TonB